jgi:hypothetical protein
MLFADVGDSVQRGFDEQDLRVGKEQARRDAGRPFVVRAPAQRLVLGHARRKPAARRESRGG